MSNVWMAPSLIALGLVGASLIVAPSAIAHSEPKPESESSGASTAPARSPAGQPRTERQSSVTVRDGRMSLRVKDRPLKDVLDEIGFTATVGIVLGEGVGAERISAEFHDLTIADGLRQILKDVDAFFYYGADGTGLGVPKIVWVYRKGSGRDLRPVPPEVWASTDELEQRVADPDPAVKARALGALLERRGSRGLDAILRALERESAEARAEILEEVASRGVELPLQLLTRLAREDPSEYVRVLALEALEGRPGGRPTAEQAMRDPSPKVRVLALDLLAGYPGVQPAAERALNDPSPLVRDKAEEVLRALKAAKWSR